MGLLNAQVKFKMIFTLNHVWDESGGVGVGAALTVSDVVKTSGFWSHK